MASIGNVGKDKLILDTSNLSESDNVGAYLRSSDGTLLTHSTVNAKESLDVNLSQLDADASAQLMGLYNEDDAHSSGDRGQAVWAVRNDTKSALAGTDGDYIPFQMDADGDLYVSDEVAQGKLDTIDASLSTIDSSIGDVQTAIESVQYAEDAVHSSGDEGNFILAVANHTEGALHSADGDYAALQVDDVGRLRVVADLDYNPQSEFEEDSVHATADYGVHNLTVRKDSLASNTSADGDYASFLSSSRGALWTMPVGTAADDAADDESPVKIGSRAVSGPLSAVSATGDRANAISDLYRRLYITTSSNIAIDAGVVTVNTIGTGEEELIAGATPLGGRRSLLIQNLGNKAIFVGPSGVTVADGIRIAAGANMPIELGEDVDIYAVSSQDGQDVRVMELG